MRIRTFAPTAFVAALVLVMGFVLGTPAVSGQEATPGTPGAAGANHPAHIHNGTCDDLGEVVYPLNNLTAPAYKPTPAASPEIISGATPETASGLTAAVAQSSTDVDVSLDELLEGEYAINVHESPENIQNYIACGNIEGTPIEGQLTVRLNELNNSGFNGTARLTDQGDGTTSVHVSLYPGDITGTPAATPSS